MTSQNLNLRGLWLPIVTPFLNGAVDLASLRRLIRHYRTQPIDGFVLAGTTGEALTLSFAEIADVVHSCADEQREIGTPIPVLLGIGGSNTRAVIEHISQTRDWPIDGYLVSCPAYSRPSQIGLLSHFEAMADATERPLIIYNIPYRTGVNLSNDTLLRLAERDNVIGIKDCCADAEQTLNLLKLRPQNFSVMTGEDLAYHAALAAGADGAILSAAHVMTQEFAKIQTDLSNGRVHEAQTGWYDLYDIAKLLFSEPSPGAVKHWLWRSGLIESRELRLPMTTISDALAEKINMQAMA
ncbi:4-hydroxy-tetrahydrodipicolinate synthase [Ruegeria sp. HKCCD8929]|uniref:4-hydroxy-tetrahydrodipicolinate synthase n=1 Tax=Ruegeria sp. HKCCD8929 TaxID=2683006 RepID=UPI00148985BF|nr:4-hydroxy-tetrahydrodipicolinate synthase [Ruegeria sp. HKCCD8929]